MPSRRVALVGANRQGPPVAIAGVLQPQFRVRGVPDGYVRVVLLDGNDNRQATHEFQGDGDYPIPEAVWMLVSVEKPTKSTICDVISRVA